MSRAATLPIASETVRVTSEPMRLERDMVPLASTGPTQVLALMTQALQQGIPVESIREIAALYRDEQNRAAALEFAKALAKFQHECPPVPVDAALTHLTRTTLAGVRKPVQYATIQAIRDHVAPHLNSNGFFVKFDAETDGDMLTAICTLTHINGHKESSRFRLPTRAKTPAMSPQAEYEAAYSFGCRIALRSVTGMRVASDDDDAANEANPEKIGPHQAALLEALLDEVKADKVKFLRWLGVASIADMLASDYTRAINALEAKRK